MHQNYHNFTASSKAKYFSVTVWRSSLLSLHKFCSFLSLPSSDETFICCFEFRSEIRLFLKNIFSLLNRLYVTVFNSFFCGIPVRTFKWRLRLARCCSLVAFSNGETASVATVNEEVSGWWMSTSLEYEGWRGSVRNVILQCKVLAWEVAGSVLHCASLEAERCLGEASCLGLFVNDIWLLCS